MVAMCGSFSSFIIPSRRLRQACQNQSSERVTQNASRWDLNPTATSIFDARMTTRYIAPVNARIAGGDRGCYQPVGLPAKALSWLSRGLVYFFSSAPPEVAKASDASA